MAEHFRRYAKDGQVFSEESKLDCKKMEKNKEKKNNNNKNKHISSFFQILFGVGESLFSSPFYF